MLFLKICSSAFRLCISFCAAWYTCSICCCSLSIRFICSCKHKQSSCALWPSHCAFCACKESYFCLRLFSRSWFVARSSAIKSSSWRNASSAFSFFVCSCKSSFCIRSFFSASALSLFTCSFLSSYNLAIAKSLSTSFLSFSIWIFVISSFPSIPSRFVLCSCSFCNKFSLFFLSSSSFSLNDLAYEIVLPACKSASFACCNCFVKNISFSVSFLSAAIWSSDFFMLAALSVSTA